MGSHIEHVAKVVAEAPPLTSEQRDKLAALLRWPTKSDQDRTALPKGEPMTKSTERDKLIREEIEQSELHPDAPEGATWTQPNRARSTVYSVRFNPEEVTRIEQIARSLDIPASTLVRSWALDAIARAETETVANAFKRVEADLRHLREVVSH